MNFLVLKGDGIGPEIVDATLDVVKKISIKLNLKLNFTFEEIGLSALKKYKTTFPKHIIPIVKKFDGIILGPVDHNNYPSEKEGGLNPSGILRSKLNLYSNIRPAKAFTGLPSISKNIDLIIVRENTEGFYSDRNMFNGLGEMEVEKGIGISIRKVTKKASERIALRGFEIARKLDKNKVVLHAIHKANVLRITDGIFLNACRKISKKFPEVTYKEMLVDAATAHLIKNPTQFNVIVTTNMFGDILSDLASELSGSLGMGGSLNVGDGIPMAQAQHGSAPDIEKKGIANPLSLIFSTGLMFNWIGHKKNSYKLKQASYLITNSVNKHLLEKKYLTFDLGGNASTSDVINSIIEKL